jgi:disulfide bond formation protein DsbB
MSDQEMSIQKTPEKRTSTNRTATLVRAIALGVGASCLGGFCVALGWEHLFGDTPCMMCMFERYGFLLTGLVGFLVFGCRQTLGIQRLLACMATTLAVTAVIMGRHLGIQKKWLELPQICRADRPLSLADLDDTGVSSGLAACDSIPFTVFNQPPTLYFLAVTVGLCLLCAWGFTYGLPSSRTPSHG